MVAIADQRFLRKGDLIRDYANIRCVIQQKGRGGYIVCLGVGPQTPLRQRSSNGSEQRKKSAVQPLYSRACNRAPKVLFQVSVLAGSQIVSVGH